MMDFISWTGWTLAAVSLILMILGLRAPRDSALHRFVDRWMKVMLVVAVVLMLTVVGLTIAEKV